MEVDSNEAAATATVDPAALEDYISQLRHWVQSNPNNYNAHVTYLAVLRSAGRRADLLHARNKMHALFPLLPQLWREWFADEAATLTESSAATLIPLFESAVSEYLSVDVWTDYIGFLIRLLVDFPTSVSVADVREVLERAVGAGGQHFTDGAALWSEYISFESAQADDESKEKTLRRIYNTCLRIPLRGIDDLFEQYSTWEMTVDEAASVDRIKSMAAVVERTKRNWDDRVKVEDALVAGQYAQQCFNDLIAFEEAQKPLEPFRLRTLYERMLAVHYLDPSVWLRYASFLYATFKNNAAVIATYKRAVRNCPRSGAIWAKYINSLERNGTSANEVKNIYFDALQLFTSRAGEADVEQAVQLHLAYVDMVRRAAAKPVEDADEQADLIEDFRYALDTALNHVLQYFPGGDPLCQLERYRIHYEYIHGKDIARARELFDQALKRWPKNADHWIEYAHYERAYGGTDHQTASILKRASLAKADDQRRLFRAWLAYEREEGTLDSVEAAEARVAVQLQILEHKEQQDAIKAAAAMPPPPAPRAKRGRAAKEDGAEDGGEKQRPSKKRAHADGAGEKPSSKHSFASSDTASSASAATESAPVAAAEAQPSPYSDAQTKTTTVFVSNLPFTATEAMLRKAFGKAGTIKEVRMITDAATGRFKGYAHVQFDEPTAVAAALAMDRQPLNGRPMFVSEWLNKAQGEKREFKMSSNEDGRVLYVSNLAVEVTDAHLRPLFEKYGELAGVRVVTKKTGESRQFAYVEFTTPEAAQSALELAGTSVEGRPISVELSAPPRPRRADDQPTVPARVTLSKASLVPRALSRPHGRLGLGATAAVPAKAAETEKKAEGDAQQPAKETGGKGQDYFRQLLKKA